MDLTTVAGTMIGGQTAQARSDIAMRVLDMNLQAERSTVLALLEPASMSSTANLGPGVGGVVDTTA